MRNMGALDVYETMEAIDAVTAETAETADASCNNATTDADSDSTDRRKWFISKRGHTQADLDEIISRYCSLFEPYAEEKSLSDEDMFTMTVFL